MAFLKAIFQSKKLGAAMLAMIVQLLMLIGLDPEVADAIAKIIMTYIAGQSVVDIGLALKGAKSGWAPKT